MTGDAGGDLALIRVLRTQNSALQTQLEALQHGGGGGTSGSVTEDWKASVDRQLDQLHKDVRNLLYAIIGAFLILAGGGLALHWSLVDKVSDLRVASEKAAGDAASRDAATNGKIDLLVERSNPKK
jgi:hypothetical protein